MEFGAGVDLSNPLVILHFKRILEVELCVIDRLVMQNGVLDTRGKTVT
jgi:hypothetical protein